MKLTREEYLKEIHNLEMYIGREFECSQVMRECEKSLDVLEQLINEHFELVEKATPKKPKEKHFEIHGYPRFDYSCPNCNMHLGLDISPLKNRHCLHCGQALDWSGDE